VGDATPAAPRGGKGATEAFQRYTAQSAWESAGRVSDTPRP